MTVLVDTSVLIDVLRGKREATSALIDARRQGPLHASEVTRLEILAGMRPRETEPTRSLLAILIWHPLDDTVAEKAGELGRRWLPGNRGIDAADLAIAATALSLEAELYTLNPEHFPMFPRLAAPY
jgi:predicted nucleic acid-binding protein